MLKFRVTKVTDSGIPRYSSEDEHALDAMIYALHGFMEKYPELVNTVEEVKYARRTFVLEQKETDPIKQKIKEVKEDKEGNNELQTHSSRARPGFSRRGAVGARGSNQLGWGRRGFTPKSKRSF